MRHSEPGEFGALARYLGLPDTPARLLGEGSNGGAPHLTALAAKWAGHPNVKALLSPSAAATEVSGAAGTAVALSGTAVSYPHRIGSLVELPQGRNSMGITCIK